MRDSVRGAVVWAQTIKSATVDVRGRSGRLDLTCRLRGTPLPSFAPRFILGNLIDPGASSSPLESGLAVIIEDGADLLPRRSNDDDDFLLRFLFDDEAIDPTSVLPCFAPTIADAVPPELEPPLDS